MHIKNKNSSFIIDNYNLAKPFSSFFPGVAGKNGIPMWGFYVNRGQCVCSIGIGDKEHPIMEFLPANRAYQLTASQGFRTFIKIIKENNFKYYEPFQNHLLDEKTDRSQQMIINAEQLELIEINRSLGLKFSVTYFNVPNDIYAGLIRILKIENIGNEALDIEGADGLPLIIPYGVDNYNLKHMRRLVEAFVEVTNYENKVPYFKGKVKQEDSPEVFKIKEGNFYAGFELKEKSSRLIEPIVDPQKIFGEQIDFSYPTNFLKTTPFKLAGRQIFENRLPCAMGTFSTKIPARETYTYISIIGHIASENDLNELVPFITKKKYIEKKKEKNTELIQKLMQNNFVNTSSNNFNQYCQQNFLDNLLRGGFPATFTSKKGDKNTLYIYSRKHGDLERDYNEYFLSPTNYSQGNGNFRDVNQNRRSDLFFNPELKESNVEDFYNLIQLDGFNPLVIKPTTFSIEDSEKLDQILTCFFDNKSDKIKLLLKNKFTPGSIFSFLNENKIKLLGDPDLFLGELLSISKKNPEADYGHSFWSDHWTYNLDLLENYLSLYPEKLHFILFEKKTFTFFDNIYRVLPRDDKYVLWDNKPMQLGSITKDEEKEAMINARNNDPNKIRTATAEIYKTTLINKIICLITNKLASLDPEGVGIEMESDKPNWYDALNGLPGMFGSSINETLELKRLIEFILQSFYELKMQNELWHIYKETHEFIKEMHDLLKTTKDPFDFWDKAASAKEKYREITKFGISGEEKNINASTLIEYLNLAIKKIDQGIEKAWDKKKNIINTYFFNQVIEYEKIKNTNNKNQFKLNKKGQICFKAKKFRQIPLPLFLEGPMHYLKVSKDKEKKSEMIREIKKSGLYDKNLKMYKVNESIENQPMEIGRTKIFTRGWLENESIWLHMEYKYILELLKSGFYKEFYQDFKNVLIPFFDPKVYGRSILENSSFIASSANPDASIHGNGFVARLSGATAEMINILLLMTVGKKPFSINNQKELELQFRPKLPAWLFTEKKEIVELYSNAKKHSHEFNENTLSFYFLSTILVTYHNPKRKDTFGDAALSPCSYTITYLDGKSKKIDENKITGKIAEDIRDRKVKEINIQLG